MSKPFDYPPNPPVADGTGNFDALTIASASDRQRSYREVFFTTSGPAGL